MLKLASESFAALPRRTTLRALLIPCVALLTVLTTPETQAQMKLTKAPIINGVHFAGAAPQVGYIIDLATGGVCTGTLIGCRTVLTAAHCVCSDGGCSLPTAVFFQHAGSVAVIDADLHPAYVGGPRHDLAVLHLAAPVPNLPILPINQAQRPPYGAPAVAVGFGQAVRGDQPDFSGGLMRAGFVTIAPCLENDAFNLCSDFVAPVGPPGEDSNTCKGDSGGPIIFGGAVAGVVSHGFNPSCLPPDHSVNADVFVDRAWIATAAGSDLGRTCAPPRVGDPGTTVHVGEEVQLSQGESVFYELPVSPGTAQLRVGLNAEVSANIDLSLRHGAVPTAGAFNCSSNNPAFLPEFCTIQNPAPGTWYALASATAGSGTFQIVATLLDAPSTSGPCVPNAETACLQGGRFEVKIGWSNSSGSGTGSVMSFGGQRAENNDSAFYSFQSPTNFEMGVKMLNACIPLFGDKFWVFVSGLTDQGWQVTVRDTQTGATKTYSNTLGNLSETFADTSAFDC